MEYRIKEIAERIHALREILDIPVETMAEATGTTPEEYRQMEAGETDFSFTFLYHVADTLGVDLTEIVTGVAPRLSFYTVVRKNQGLPIQRREGFSYLHMAHLFKNRLSEPFIVTAPYREEDQNKPIRLSVHEGQEFDLILKGSLKVVMENHVEVLHEGDAIYYDSGHGHGMIATGGEDCVFLAVVMKKED